MADNKKENNSTEKKNGSSGGKESSDGCFAKTGTLGCGCLVLILLIASFILGIKYGKDIMEVFTQKAHRGIDAASKIAHESIDKADKKIVEEK